MNTLYEGQLQCAALYVGLKSCADSCSPCEHNFSEVFKGDGEGLQFGELGQEISAGFGPGSKSGLQEDVTGMGR